ncbi:MAG: hypothetical protein U0936_18585 [Planctomycetaceae bacterium]
MSPVTIDGAFKILADCTYLNEAVDVGGGVQSASKILEVDGSRAG